MCVTPSCTIHLPNFQTTLILFVGGFVSLWVHCLCSVTQHFLRCPASSTSWKSDFLLSSLQLNHHLHCCSWFCHLFCFVLFCFTVHMFTSCFHWRYQSLAIKLVSKHLSILKVRYATSFAIDGGEEPWSFCRWLPTCLALCSIAFLFLATEFLSVSTEFFGDLYFPGLSPISHMYYTEDKEETSWDNQHSAIT